jgi:beta-lactamase class A
MNQSRLSGLRLVVLFAACLAFYVPVHSSASAQSPARPAFAPSERLQALVGNVVNATIERFGKGGLTADKIRVTLIDLHNHEHPAWASHRGQESTYPASVVKLFYLVAAHHQMENGELKATPELERALHDMIVDSSNDATHYVFNALTGTTDGLELDEAALKDWLARRNVVNRYFASLGFDRINTNQKTWCEGPYGRERQSLGPNFENRNKLTTEATARLLFEIVTERAVTAARCRAMMNLLHRDPSHKSADPDDQATQFAGKLLPAGAQLYSKAGWTSATRHDAAYIRLPNGAEYILTVFTVDNSSQVDIIPFVSQLVAEAFSRTPLQADLVLTNGRFTR